MMIQERISTIKDLAKFKVINEIDRLLAVSELEKLMEEIDFNSEVVVADNFEKLKSLFTSLKGDDLSISELKVIDEIIGC